MGTDGYEKSEQRYYHHHVACASGSPGQGGSNTQFSHVMHSRSLMPIDPRIPTMPGRRVLTDQADIACTGGGAGIFACSGKTIWHTRGTRARRPGGGEGSSSVACPIHLSTHPFRDGASSLLLIETDTSNIQVLFPLLPYNSEYLKTVVSAKSTMYIAVQHMIV